MTPAVTILKRQNIPYTLHKYQHDPKIDSYGLEAAEKLDLPPGRVFKTLIAILDTGELVVAIVPVTSMLNLKELARGMQCQEECPG